MLVPGGERVKSRIRAGNANYKEMRIEKRKQSREHCEINIIGSWGEPMRKHAAVQDWPFALVRAYAANTRQHRPL